jgi:hypothetical protein
VLSLLVALISVSGVFLPALSKLVFQDPKPKVEIGGSHSSDWQAFQVVFSNLKDVPTVLPTMLSCTPSYMGDEPAVPPRFTYFSSSSAYLPANGSAEVQYAFSHSFHTDERNTVELEGAFGIVCNGNFRNDPEYSISMKFENAALKFFYLMEENKRYYP